MSIAAYSDSNHLIQSCSLRVIKAVDLPFATHRQLHHWKKLGLIDEHRGQISSGAHHRFSFFEVVWIRCIALMRELGTDNKHILFAKEDVHPKQKQPLKVLTPLQEVIMKAFTKQQQSLLLVFGDKRPLVLAHQAYIDFIQKDGASGYFCLQLYPLLDELISLLKDYTELALIFKQWTTNTADKH